MGKDCYVRAFCQNEKNLRLSVFDNEGKELRNIIDINSVDLCIRSSRIVVTDKGHIQIKCML